MKKVLLVEGVLENSMFVNALDSFIIKIQLCYCVTDSFGNLITMFGVTVKIWNIAKEEEEFSVVITHVKSVKQFLMAFFNILSSEFSVNQKTVDEISMVEYWQKF